MAASVRLDLVPGDDAARWQITLTLTPADQAALDALHPSASQLCAAAQHTLRLAVLGSQSDPAHNGAGAGRGRVLLAVVGERTLWWIANSPPAALREAIDHLLNLKDDG